MGVLNNAVYLSLLEEARYRYFAELGLIDQQQQFGFVLGQTNIRFLAPGHGPAEVTIEMDTVRVGHRSFDQAYRVFGPDQSVWVEANATMVWWDAQKKCSAQTPPEFLSKIHAND